MDLSPVTEDIQVQIYLYLLKKKKKSKKLPFAVCKTGRDIFIWLYGFFTIAENILTVT